MQAANWRSWVWMYGLPTLLLVGALAFLALVLQDPDAPVLIWTFIVAPVLAFLLGALTLPSRVWVTPSAVTVLVAIMFLGLTALDILDPMSVFGTLALLPVFIGLPLMVMTWFGRGVRLVLADWWRRRGSGDTRSRRSGHLLS